MSKTIELIDKYVIKQHGDGEYNPPSYIWTDNTGELVRCADCMYYNVGKYIPECEREGGLDDPSPDEYCSRGERK